jgi:hypothetical protein
MTIRKGDELLLDGTTPVHVLHADEFDDGLNWLVAVKGTRASEWVRPERLMRYDDPRARPPWREPREGIWPDGGHLPVETAA